MTIAINSNTRRNITAQLSLLYSNCLPLAKAKYDDIMSLCHNGIIPATYHDFFRHLSFVAGSHNDGEYQSDSE